MKRNRHTPEQIIRKPREADADLAGGLSGPEICKELGIAEDTYCRWRNRYGGMRADEMKRLKDLEREDARLKALVADPTLDEAILREALRGNRSARPGGGRPSSESARPWASPSVGRAERRASPDRPGGTSGPNEDQTRRRCRVSPDRPESIPAPVTAGSRHCGGGRAGRSTASGSIDSGGGRAWECRSGRGDAVGRAAARTAAPGGVPSGRTTSGATISSSTGWPTAGR